MKPYAVALVLLIAGCAVPAPRGIDPSIQRELAQGDERRKPPAPQLEQALLPPLRMEMPQAAGQAIDQRFDLSVSNAPAAQVFMSLVSGTRYSMLVHPTVSGNISINLKDVSLREALDSIRELYGYEYAMDGNRIVIQPAGVQTRVFQVNYLALQRRGLSQTRVTAGTLAETAASAGGAGSQTGAATGIVGQQAGGAAGGGGGSAFSQPGGAVSRESTRVTTNQEAIFWSDLCEALAAITFPPEPGGAAVAAAGNQQPEDRQRNICNRRHSTTDRSIVVSPHSGVIVVRAMPAELRAVENYLKATRLAVERQVMLEAKIIEVELSDEFQSGINWAVFNRHAAVGQITRPGSGGQASATASSLRDAATAQILGGPAGAVFGLAVATSNFAALLTFLESQGNVQVLSSPRVATLNNQKAVLKVGDEQLFVSNVSVIPTTNPTTGVVTGSIATPQFTSYFSGIVLDVTPQIDEAGYITLHVHPSINTVTNNATEVDLGSGNIKVPTAKSVIRETDTIVRIGDGNIVAIGGLMRVDVDDTRSGLPGVKESGLGAFFRNTNRRTRKMELVVLLKPTVVESDRDWAQGISDSRGRMNELDRQMEQRGGR